MLIKLLCIINDAEDGEFERLVRSLADVQVEIARSGHEGIAMLKSSSFDVLLARFPLMDWQPEDLLEESHRADWLLPVLISDPAVRLGDVVRLTKLGAWHCLGGELNRKEIGDLIQSAAEDVRSRRVVLCGAGAIQEPWRNLLVGDSRGMQNVFQVIRLIGARRSTVLITGETGTGKEMVARAIHMASPRSHLPMVAVNCSALPENLLEAELSGT